MKLYCALLISNNAYLILFKYKLFIEKFYSIRQKTTDLLKILKCVFERYFLLYFYLTLKVFKYSSSSSLPMNHLEIFSNIQAENDQKTKNNSEK